MNEFFIGIMLGLAICPLILQYVFIKSSNHKSIDYSDIGVWKCPNCDTKRKGFQTTCPCGYEKELF